MILWGFLLVAGVALAPVFFSWWRGAAGTRDRREAAQDLHRAQLEELERDRAEGRLGGDEYAAAVLEVQRRLLTAARTAEPATGGARFSPLLLVPLVLLGGAGLYLVGGVPEMPALQAQAARDEAVLDTLRQRLAAMDPKSEQARQGFLLLGNAEAGQQHMAAAAAAWRVALAARFEASLAAVTAEAMSEAEGRVTEEAAALFRAALAAAPADAPWRPMVERRLREVP